MLFHTTEFFLFFAIFFSLYLLLRSHLRWQNALLFIASYTFYGAWDERFLALIMISTATDYIAGLGAAGRQLSKKDGVIASSYLLIGTSLVLSPTFSESWTYLAGIAVYTVCGWFFARAIRHKEEEKRRYLWVCASLVLNLGLLSIFKYFNFFADSLVGLTSVFGIELDWVTLNIVLPVGISFYTFQTLSYTIDIYRGRMQPTDKLLELATYIAFFPQLVAGPIERAKALLPQFFEKREVTAEKLASGFTLFMWGMYKKAVIADNLSPIANRVFANPDAMSSGELWVGLLAFTFQIYCDFSGYSDMARGIARMMGFELMMNFNLPYISRTPSEFWRRWHISLSSWLRDYLYIALGGNRGGNRGTYRNLMLTMILGGLWHGAAWTFVLWGFYQGAVLVLYRITGIDQYLELKEANGGSRFETYSRNIIMASVFFLFTMMGWLIFRAESMGVIGQYVGGLAAIPSGGLEVFIQFLMITGPLLVIQALQVHYGKLEIFPELNRFMRFNTALFVICALLFMSYQGTVEFIYFDF